MAGGDRPEKAAAEHADSEKGQIRRVFAWIGENFAKGAIAALAAVAVGALIALVFADHGKHRTVDATIGHKALRNDGWPNGKSARTVILASAPTKGQAEAVVDEAKRIPSRGLSLGILHSDNYASLEPGYWVAFAGEFDSADEAQRAVERYRREFPTAYQRFIEEK